MVAEGGGLRGGIVDHGHQLAPIDAARGVDLLDGEERPAQLVGGESRRHRGGRSVRLKGRKGEPFESFHRRAFNRRRV